MLDNPDRDGGMSMDEDEGEAFDGPSPSCDQPEDQLEEFLDCWCGHSISMDASEANMDVTPKRLLDSSWSSTETAGLTPVSSSSALTPAANLRNTSEHSFDVTNHHRVILPEASSHIGVVSSEPMRACTSFGVKESNPSSAKREEPNRAKRVRIRHKTPSHLARCPSPSKAAVKVLDKANAIRIIKSKYKLKNIRDFYVLRTKARLRLHQPHLNSRALLEAARNEFYAMPEEERLQWCSKELFIGSYAFDSKLEYYEKIRGEEEGLETRMIEDLQKSAPNRKNDGCPGHLEWQLDR